MEIEAKFTIPDEATAQALRTLDRVGDFTIAVGREKEVEDTYWDTLDRRLLSHGLACRLRREGTRYWATLKAAPETGGPIHRREEVEVGLPSAQPPSAWPDTLRHRIRQVTKPAHLIPLFRLHQRRYVRPILLDGRRIAEMSVDDVRMTYGGETLHYRELEVELKGGTESQLTAIIAALRAAYPLTAEPRSKFQRGLAFVDAVLPLTAILPRETPGLTPDDTMAEAAHKVLAFHFRRLLLHEPGTRLGLDPEALHDMRVATRRMRSAFRVFGPYLDMRRMRPYVKELRRLGRILGRVRDMDVFWIKTEAYLAARPSSARPELEGLRQMWEVAHRRARRAMVRHLDGKRYRRFTRAFAARLEQPFGTPPPSDALTIRPYRLRHIAPYAVYHRLAEVRAYEGWVEGPDVPLQRYHALRIAAKHLRYTLEFFREILLPEAAGQAIARIKALQDHLGDLQDAVVAGERLRNLRRWGRWDAPTATEPRTFIPLDDPGLARYLAAREAEAHQLLRDFPRVWRDIASPAYRQTIARALTEL